MFLNEVMEETRKIYNSENEPPLKIFLFLKMKIINFFLITMDQKYQNAMQKVQKLLKTL